MEREWILTGHQKVEGRMAVGWGKGYIIHPNLTVSKCLRFCHLPH